MPTFGTAGRTFGGLSVDRSVFRELLPDARWYVYAAGMVDPGDGNVATLSLIYVEDTTGTTHTLGSTTKTGAGLVKFDMGPFDVFGTSGVPAGEDVPVIQFKAAKDAGVDGTVSAVTLWVRFLPATQ